MWRSTAPVVSGPMRPVTSWLRNTSIISRPPRHNVITSMRLSETESCMRRSITAGRRWLRLRDRASSLEGEWLPRVEVVRVEAPLTM
jgi:hypothetical protein